MRLLLRKLWEEQSASLVEYILLLVFIGIVAIVGLTALGQAVNNKLTGTTNGITGQGREGQRQ